MTNNTTACCLQRLGHLRPVTLFDFQSLLGHPPKYFWQVLQTLLGQQTGPILMLVFPHFSEISKLSQTPAGTLSSVAYDQ